MTIYTEAIFSPSKILLISMPLNLDSIEIKL